MSSTISVLRTWALRRWLVAAGAGALAVLVVAVPTDLIDTPVFSRSVPPTWWAWPSLAASGLLGGLLTATYVPDPAVTPTTARAEFGDGRDGDRGGAWGGTCGVLTFFAVGCPVCNKLVLLALGTSGALTWFAPMQPALSLAALITLGWALRRRLAGELACPFPSPGPAAPGRRAPRDRPTRSGSAQSPRPTAAGALTAAQSGGAADGRGHRPGNWTS